MTEASPAAAPALEITGLTKRYHETLAVADLSLRVDGGVFGLLGANGAGKSTLLKSLLGLVHPDAGEIRVFGIDARRSPIEAKRRIGYLPEELRLYDRLTGWEFLEFTAGLKGVEFEADAEEILRLFGLFDRRDELIGEYSLGMRKKIGIAAAMLGRPPLLLLDEPLNGLDAESMRSLRVKLEELAAAGTTIIVSSHVMGFVERVCREVCVLKKGRVAAQGAPAELRERTAMPDAPFDDVFLSLAL